MALSLYDLNKDKANKILATNEHDGLMSAVDKIKLDLLDYYVHPDTHPATMITGLAAVATSGSYNDLLDKPIGGITIGDDLTLKNLMVTEQTNLYNVDINEQGSFALGENLTIATTKSGFEKTYTTFVANHMAQSFIIVNDILYTGTGVGVYGQGGNVNITGELYSLAQGSTIWVKKADRYSDYSTILSMASIGNIIYAIALNINSGTSVLLSYDTSLGLTTWTLESEELPSPMMLIVTLNNIIYGIDNAEGGPLYAFNTTLSAPISWESLITTPVSDAIVSFTTLNGKIYAGTYMGKLVSFTPGESVWVELSTAYNYNGENLLMVMPLTIINGIIYGTTSSNIDNHCILLSFNPTLSTVWELENIAPLSNSATPIISFAILNNEIYAISSQYGVIYKFIIGMPTTSEVISMGVDLETYTNLDMYYAGPIVGFNNTIYIGAYVKDGIPSPNLYFITFLTVANITLNNASLYGTVDAKNLVINNLTFNNLEVGTLINNNMIGDTISLGNQIVVDETLAMRSGYNWIMSANAVLDSYGEDEGVVSLVTLNGIIYAGTTYGKLLSFTIGSSTSWEILATKLGNNNNAKLIIYQGTLYAVTNVYAAQDQMNILSYTPGLSTGWELVLTTTLNFNYCSMEIYVINDVIYGVCVREASPYDTELYSFTLGVSTDWTLVCSLTGVNARSSLVLDNKIYIGTINPGQLYSFTPGDISFTLRADEFEGATAITALTKMYDRIYASAGLGCKLLYFDPMTSTSWELIANTFQGDPTTNTYPIALVSDENGSIYCTMAGSTINGNLYVSQYNGPWDKIIKNSPPSQVITKMLFVNGMLYATSSNKGDLYIYGYGAGISYTGTEILTITDTRLKVNGDLEVTGDIIGFSGGSSGGISTLIDLDINISPTEINYLSGVTSNVQQQISTLISTDINLQYQISTHTHDGGGGIVTTLSTLGIIATAEELNYVDGVSGNIQTQLNGKAAINHTHSTFTTLTDLGITATAPELNILDGVTGVTSTEINYLSGVTSNIQTQISVLATNSNGVDVRKLLYHSNKCANSSFELFNFATGVPYYWSTEGIVSNDSNFDGNYSLKLTYQQAATQKAELDGGLWNPSWWSEYPNTRISFRCKATNVATGILYVYVKDSNDVLQNITYSDFNAASGTWVPGLTSTYLSFTPGNNWSEGFFTFTANCSTNDFHRIEFYNNGNSDLYLDAVTIEPDIGDSGPSIYHAGIKSTGSIDVGGRKLFISSEDPISIAVNGDVWIDIS